MFKTLTFIAVAGLVATPFANAGACTGSADAAIVANKDKVDGIAETCGVSCLLSSTPESCIASCMSSKASLSAGCADCFGKMGVCAKSNCAFQCLNPKSSSCVSCTTAHCKSTFDSCAGTSDESMAQFATCSSDDRTKLVNKATTTVHLKTCATSCTTSTSCMATCMEKATGISATCGSCFSGFSTCTVAHCLWDCVGNPAGDACQACASKNCQPTLDVCTGLTSIVPAAHPMAQYATCSGDDRTKLVNKATTTVNLKACATSCTTSTSCMATCMENKTGISATCGSCFSGFSTCTVAHCLWDCVGNPAGDACQACASKNCQPTLDVCTGLTSL